jgi:hypothetical protein
MTLDYMFISVLLIGVKLSRTLHHKCNMTTLNDLHIFKTHHYIHSYTYHYISSLILHLPTQDRPSVMSVPKCDKFASIYLFNLCLHMSQIQIENVIKLISMK